MFMVLLFGALGGVARGLVGYTKYLTSYKDVKFDPKYFGMNVLVSMVVGLGTVWALDGSGLAHDFTQGFSLNPAVALIIGYAGGDAIENIYKIILKKPILVPTAK